MNTQRLSIGTLQIYVEDGVPRFKDRQGVRTLESVREELHEWKRFLEDWLEKVEPPPALHKLTPEELSLALMQMAHEWRHLGFSNERADGPHRGRVYGHQQRPHQNQGETEQSKWTTQRY